MYNPIRQISFNIVRLKLYNCYLGVLILKYAL